MRNYKYETIYIERYNIDRLFKDEQIVFNHFETEELLGAEQAGIILKMYQKENKKFNRSVNHDGIDIDITRVCINLNNLEAELLALSEELIKQSDSVSGDDDAFDYFPDLVFAFEQVCKQTKRIDIYNTTVITLNNLLEYKEDDELYLEQV